MLTTNQLRFSASFNYHLFPQMINLASVAYFKRYFGHKFQTKIVTQFPLNTQQEQYLTKALVGQIQLFFEAINCDS